MADGKEVVLDNDKPGAEVVEATLPKLNPVFDVESALPTLNPLVVVVVALFKLNDGVVDAPGKLNPDVVLAAAVPRLKPMPVVVIEVVVTVDAPSANPLPNWLIKNNFK